jgi:metal-responsive CopG/Arc/MetJ family transcriptional regulator
MVVTPFRLPRTMREELDRLVPLTGLPDRSALVRRLLADGIRRARAARDHPALLPDDLRPPAGPPGP